MRETAATDIMSLFDPNSLVPYGHGYTTSHIADLIGYPVPTVRRVFNELRVQGKLMRNPIDTQLIIPVPTEATN